MILDFNEYKIITDERQFIIQKKKVIQEGRFTNAENIGKEYYENDGYYSNLNSALKSLGKSIVLENDDLLVIQNKLSQLQSKIEEFTRMLELNK